jgi:L-threonylcarbamoyladenylate synthase
VPLILRVDAKNPEDAIIRQAAGMIRDGRVVAYPTDTLYGLAVDPRNTRAVKRLFELKGRPETSALTLIAADVGQVRDAAEMTRHAERLAQRLWPGPLTIVMRARPSIAPETLAGGLTVGVRVPDHPVAAELARAAGFAITATSANQSGAPAVSSAEAVAASLPGVDVILDGGPSRGGAASTIVNACDADVSLIRAGAVPWERVIKSLASGA